MAKNLLPSTMNKIKRSNKKTLRLLEDEIELQESLVERLLFLADDVDRFLKAYDNSDEKTQENEIKMMRVHLKWLNEKLKGYK